MGSSEADLQQNFELSKKREINNLRSSLEVVCQACYKLHPGYHRYQHLDSQTKELGWCQAHFLPPSDAGWKRPKAFEHAQGFLWIAHDGGSGSVYALKNHVS